MRVVTPDDVSLALPDRLSALEGGSSIGCPGHLEDTGGPLTPSTRNPGNLSASQILNKLAHGGQESCPLHGRQSVELVREPRRPGVRRQGRLLQRLGGVAEGF
jgi:hypothetical protein